MGAGIGYRQIFSVRQTAALPGTRLPPQQHKNTGKAVKFPLKQALAGNRNADLAKEHNRLQVILLSSSLIGYSRSSPQYVPAKEDNAAFWQAAETDPAGTDRIGKGMTAVFPAYVQYRADFQS